MSPYLEDLGRFPRGSDAYDEIRKMRMKEGDRVGEGSSLRAQRGKGPQAKRNMMCA